MELHDRLRQARISAGLDTAAAAAAQLGVAKATYTAHENGSRGVPLDEIQRYARRLKVAPEWLAFGVGGENSLASSAPAPTRVELYEDVGEAATLVPVYNVAASAGHGALVDCETVTHTLAFPPDYLKRITSSSPQNLAIISVKGDSMEPTLSDDDIVMLDMSKTSLGFEGLFVIRIYDVLHVKRLSHARPGFVEVISDNRVNYPPREYSVEDIEVVGKVLWSGGKI